MGRILSPRREGIEVLPLIESERGFQLLNIGPVDLEFASPRFDLFEIRLVLQPACKHLQQDEIFQGKDRYKLAAQRNLLFARKGRLKVGGIGQ